MAPVETKVKASGAAALAAGLIDWALATYVFKGHHMDAAVTAEIYAAIPAAITTAAGYLAPHTSRAAAVVTVAATGATGVTPVPPPPPVPSGAVLPPAPFTPPAGTI